MESGWDRLTRTEERVRDRTLAPLLKFFPSWITPNRVTGLRLALVAVAVCMYLIDSPLGPQLAVLGLAAATDLVDGPLARSRGQSGGIGAVLDHTIDWALGGWMGVLSCLHGLVGVRLAVLMILPQAFLFSLNYRQQPDRTTPGFVPSAVTRFQFLAVLGGFGLLLIGRLVGRRTILSLGYALLYVEISIAFVLTGQALVAFGRRR